MLTTIRRDVPITLDLIEAKFWNYDRSKVVGLLRELEFSSMVSRIPAPHGEGEQLGFAIEEEDEIEKMPTDYITVSTRQALDDMVSQLTETGQFSFDTETIQDASLPDDRSGLRPRHRPCPRPRKSRRL